MLRMTPKQMYSELAKIAGKECESGSIFVKTENVTGQELQKIQKSILALLDKLNYDRTNRDFRNRTSPSAEWARSTQRWYLLDGDELA